MEKTFPKPIDRWAIQDANIALDKKRHKKQKSVTLPVDKVHPLLKVLYVVKFKMLNCWLRS